MALEESLKISKNAFPKIIVFGVGGAGVNIVNNMILSQLDGIKYVASNTDGQSLANSLAERKVQLGIKCTKGLGAGSNPEIGHQAAEEACDAIKRELTDEDGNKIDMLFIATGLGGGTGTGASPVIAKIAKDLGILTVVMAIKPFALEGKKRMETANKGVAELESLADTLIIVENQKLMKLNNVSMFDNYAVADGVLRQAVFCVTNILMKQGFINRDFADIRTVLSSAGRAVIGYGEDVDPKVATEMAIHNQILENSHIRGAKNILVNISGNHNIKSSDLEDIVNKIRNEAKIEEDDEPNVIFGIVFDEDIGNNIRVSVIAAGVEKNCQTNYFNNDVILENQEIGVERNIFTQEYSDSFSNAKKIEAPVFTRPLDEDDLANDESFNLKTENIHELNEKIIPFKNTFFSNLEGNKKVSKIEEKDISEKHSNTKKIDQQQSAELFDSCNKKAKKRPSLISKIINSIGSMPEIENNKSWNDKLDSIDESNDSDEDKDIYNTPAIKRKIG